MKHPTVPQMSEHPGTAGIEAIIQVSSLVKQYLRGAQPAVAGVSFDVRRGEIFSLLGPNGAGKTTTLSMLCGLLQPTSGDATVVGHSILHAPMEVKRVLGVVPQELALYGTLSARQNLTFWGQMYDMGGKELARRVDELLDYLGLKERANDRIEHYSGGMKRRVNIGVGLLHRPQVLFLDEPTVGIDPQSRRAILDLVKELNRQGMTVLYTTHYMEEAEELSHRVGIMDSGRLIALGTQGELTCLVGEADTILLDVDTGQESIAAIIAAIPGVRQAQLEAGRVLILTDNATAALPAILTATAAVGVRVTRIEIQEPNLEAVFLHLTGRALRE